MSSAIQKPLRSLKSKALQLLAQREQSRVELRRKLTAHASKIAEADREAAHGDTPASTRVRAARRPEPSAAVPTVVAGCDASVCDGKRFHETASAFDRRKGGVCGETAGDVASQVDAALAWLDARGFASDDRFAESRVNARSARYGDVRIRQELKQHGVALDPAAVKALRDTEASRAWSVWQRRFGSPPTCVAEAAKQARFLAARGFSNDNVRHVLRRAGQVGGDMEPLSESG